MTKTVYLDMDGVVADWDKRARLIVGYSSNDPKQHYPDKDWQKIIDDKHFYRKLDKTPWADDLVNLARLFRDQLGYNLLFLTAIPHNNDVPWAFWDKIHWAEEHFPDIPVHFGPYSRDKHLHARPNDILIDDRPDNCQDWTNTGATAIRLYKKNFEQAIQQLQDIFDDKSSLKRLRSLS